MHEDSYFHFVGTEQFLSVGGRNGSEALSNEARLYQVSTIVVWCSLLEGVAPIWKFTLDPREDRKTKHKRKIVFFVSYRADASVLPVEPCVCLRGPSPQTPP